MADPLAGGGLLPMIDLNPISWLGDAASAAVADVWKTAMIGLWSAGLWLLTLAFKIIDAFTTPDLSALGPVSERPTATSSAMRRSPVPVPQGIGYRDERIWLSRRSALGWRAWRKAGWVGLDPPRVGSGRIPAALA